MSTQIQKAFEISHENRNFEIELFWKRALFFWGFIASTFVAYAALKKDGLPLALPVSCFGLVCSLGWSFANRGSKYWQEYWERKVEKLEAQVVGNLFVDSNPVEQERGLWAARKVSVSKITMFISDYLTLFWASASLYEIKLLFGMFPKVAAREMGLCYFGLTIVYVCYVGQFIQSKPEGLPRESTDASGGTVI